MNGSGDDSSTNRLPLVRPLPWAYGASLVVALILALVSAAGLLFRTEVYPTEELANAFVSNDIVNVFIGLPILLGSLWLTRRGALLGLLFWPGALFYVMYNSIISSFALPLSLWFLLHLTLVALSAYTMAGILASIDGAAVQQQLAGAVPERLGGGVLMLLGGFVFLLVIQETAAAINAGVGMSVPDRALHIADYWIAPAWIIGGWLLWRRSALGYVAGLGLLFQATMLFVGLIAVMLLQPLVSDTFYTVSEFAVVLVMSLICFVPFALFLRGSFSRRVLVAQPG